MAAHYPRTPHAWTYFSLSRKAVWANSFYEGMKFFRYAQKDRGKLKMVILFLIENVTRTFLVIASLRSNPTGKYFMSLCIIKCYAYLEGFVATRLAMSKGLKSPQNVRCDILIK